MRTITRCIDHRGDLAPARSGQALFETALVLPVALFLLLAVAVLGHAMVTRQRLLVAARFMAREASMAATQDAVAGKFSGVTALAMAQGSGLSGIAQQALPGVSVAAAPLPSLGAPELTARPLGPYATAYLAHDPSGRYGLGFILYGGEVESGVLDVDLAADLDGVGKELAHQSGPPVWQALKLSARAYMPGELPIHVAGGAGLLEVNPWISKIVEESGP